jgi:hypothetical protein
MSNPNPNAIGYPRILGLSDPLIIGTLPIVPKRRLRSRNAARQLGVSSFCYIVDADCYAQRSASCLHASCRTVLLDIREYIDKTFTSAGSSQTGRRRPLAPVVAFLKRGRTLCQSMPVITVSFHGKMAAVHISAAVFVPLPSALSPGTKTKVEFKTSFSQSNCQSPINCKR